jgi:hypothetical protein
MNIVYIILAHQLPQQLIRLVKRLQSADVTFVIHLDKRMDKRDVAQIHTGLKKDDNIHYVPSHYCAWSDFGSTHAANKAISLIINEKIPCDFAILLSGQDYPLRPRQELLQFLEANPGKCFMEFFPMPTDKWQNGGMERVNRWHFSLPWLQKFRKPWRLSTLLLNFMVNAIMPQRTFPAGFSPYGGAQWWGFNRECLEYIHVYNAAHPKFWKFFRHAYHSSEIFYQTLLLNSPLATQFENQILTYVDWSGNPAPKILTVDDYQPLLESGKFFARKFNEHQDTRIFDLLDNHLLGKE